MPAFMRLLLTFTILAAAALARPTGKIAASEPDRSPIDLAIEKQGRYLVTSNATADTLSLVDLEAARVVQEIDAGNEPVAVAFAGAGGPLWATSRADGQLREYLLEQGRLKAGRTLEVGFEPRGLALSRDGSKAYVCLEASGEIAVVDLTHLKVSERIAVGPWPRTCALAPDESRLAVATSGNLSVAVVDTKTQRTLFEESVGGINLGQIEISADGQYAYLPWMVYRQNVITPANIRKGWVLGSRIGRIRLDGPARREAITLDVPGLAVSDPYGLALSRDGEWIVATGSGTHELLVYHWPDLVFESFGGPGDLIDRRLAADRGKFYRLPLGGRPMAVRFLPDGHRVAVVNYLSNSLQIVDLAKRAIDSDIALGGPSEPSLVRQGAALFYDGQRSLDQWYSCHTCHYDGGPNAVTMDTRNDGSSHTFKTVPSLANVARTEPWTWHGWQQDLADAVHTSLTETMLGPPPTRRESAALVAFLGSLGAVESPYRQQPERAMLERGRAIFESARAGCSRCHSGPLFSDGHIHDVGLGSPRDVYDGYNTPSLLGVYRRVRLLHDGRARSLEEVVTGPHAPDKVTGQGDLTEAEVRDLVAYLKSL